MFLFGSPNIEKLKAKRDIQGLMKVLGNQKDNSIRRAAAVALGDLKDALAVEPLIAALKASNDLLLEHETKWKIGEPPVDCLIVALKVIDALEGSDKGLRRASAEALGKIGDAQAVDSLIAALNDVSEFSLAHEAIRVMILATADTDSACIARSAQMQKSNRPYRDFLIDKALLDRVDAARARIWRAVETGLNSDMDVRKAAAEALGRISDARVVDPLIAALKGSIDMQLQTFCLLDKAPPTVLAALKSSSERVRVAAAAALGKIGDTRAVDPLIAILKDSGDSVSWILRDSDSVRLSAVDALGQINDARASEALRVVLRHDGNWTIRREAAVYLGRIGDVMAVDSLISALQDSSEMVRRAAAAALGKIGDARAVGPLTAAMKDGEKHVGDAAAEALAQIRNRR